jgi:hypothetical protein
MKKPHLVTDEMLTRKVTHLKELVDRIEDCADVAQKVIDAAILQCYRQPFNTTRELFEACERYQAMKTKK